MDSTHETTVLVILIGTAVFALMSFAIMYVVVANKRQLLKAELEKKQKEITFNKEVQRSFIEGREKEKQELARYIHDELGGSLARINFQLEAYLMENQKAGLVSNSRELSQMVHQQVRKLSGDLLPYKLMENTLVEVLTDHINALNKQGKIVFVLKTEKIEDLPEVSLMFKTLVYRIVQELCTNALKHSKAENVTITVSGTAETFSLKYRDDGSGLTSKSIKFGTGMNNIKAYTNYLGGNLKVKPSEQGLAIDLTGLDVEKQERA